MTIPAPWSNIALRADGIVKPSVAEPKYFAASISFKINVGSLTVLYSSSTLWIGAVPTKPITAVFTVLIVLAPFSISIVSTPCKKLAAI